MSVDPRRVQRTRATNPRTGGHRPKDLCFCQVPLPYVLTWPSSVKCRGSVGTGPLRLVRGWRDSPLQGVGVGGALWLRGEFCLVPCARGPCSGPLFGRNVVLVFFCWAFLGYSLSFFLSSRKFNAGCLTGQSGPFEEGIIIHTYCAWVCAASFFSDKVPAGRSCLSTEAVTEMTSIVIKQCFQCGSSTMLSEYQSLTSDQVETDLKAAISWRSGSIEWPAVVSRAVVQTVRGQICHCQHLCR